MVLPQSSAFRTLNARLAAAAAPAARWAAASAATGGSDGAAEWEARVSPELLSLFVARQEAHAADEARRRAEAEGLRTEEDIRREHRAQAEVARRSDLAAAAAVSGGGGGGGAGEGAAAAAATDGVASLTLQPPPPQAQE